MLDPTRTPAGRADLADRARLVAMTQRKTLSKGLRFDVFRRDGFTCQYCGRRPPDVVLEIDHITPVVEGGDNDLLNLVSACEDCNRGKGRKLLNNPQRPDADLHWLEAQQEIAEMQRYQKAKTARDAAFVQVIEMLQQTWCDYSGLEWQPAANVIRCMLRTNPPEDVERAIEIVADMTSSGYFSRGDGKWLPYMRGILRRMREEADGPR